MMWKRVKEASEANAVVKEETRRNYVEGNLKGVRSQNDLYGSWVTKTRVIKIIRTFQLNLNISSKIDFGILSHVDTIHRKLVK